MSMETTWQCPRCRHRNSPDDEECAKCTCSKPAPDVEPELHVEPLASNATTWIIGGGAFAFIILVGILCRPEGEPVSTPVFASVSADDAPPVARADLPSMAGSAPMAIPAGGSPSGAPGQAVTAKGEWHTVVKFQGAGRMRTQTFSIRSRYWRLNWATNPYDATVPDRDWFGPGSDFKASVFRAPKEQVGEVANYANQYSSVLPLRGTGKFYADVNSPYKWDVVVEEWRQSP
jgi:hypothetical protein